MPGTYTIKLNITDLRGNWDNDTVTIVVLDVTGPIANAGSDQIVDEDTLVAFDGTNSTDNVRPTNFTWTFVNQTHQTVELSGKVSEYNFTTPGIYNVTLIVTDAAGNADADNIIITVLDVTPPTADAGANQTVYVNDPLSFDASASSDNYGEPNNLTYAWTFTDKALQTLYGANPPYTFHTPGTYLVTLKVTDTAGNSASDNVTVTVQTVPIWLQLWFWSLTLPLLTILSILSIFFWQRRTEGVSGKLQRLARKFVLCEEKKKKGVLKKLEKLKEKADVETRKFIEESWSSFIAREEGLRYIEEQKRKKATKTK